MMMKWSSPLFAESSDIIINHVFTLSKILFSKKSQHWKHDTPGISSIYSIKLKHDQIDVSQIKKNCMEMYGFDFEIHYLQTK